MGPSLLVLDAMIFTTDKICLLASTSLKPGSNEPLQFLQLVNLSVSSKMPMPRLKPGLRSSAILMGAPAICIPKSPIPGFSYIGLSLRAHDQEVIQVVTLLL